MALPREPRQKMINIMYLVLTAILALNVSAEVINAFKTVDKSLTDSNINIEKGNETLFTSLADKVANAETREKASIWAPKANNAKQLSDVMYNYIESLKTQVKKQADLKVDKNGIPVLDKNGNEDFKFDYLEASTRVFEKNGEGKVLYQKLSDYRTAMLGIDSSIDPITFPVNLSIPPSHSGNAKTGNPVTDWTASYFHMTPAIAALTMLSKIQNNIKNAENQVVTYCHNQIGAVKLIYNQFKPIIGTSSTYLMPGEEMTVTAGIGSFSSAASPTITINGESKQADADGVATKSFKVGGSGSVHVKITYKKPDGTTGEVEKDIPYTVGQPSSAAISLDKMNVFYVGLDNPITIGSPTGMEQTGVVGTNCTVSGSGPHRTVKVTGTGECSITVSPKGSTPLKMAFRIKRIPEPTFMVGSGKARMPSVDLKSQTVCRADMGPDFIYDVHYSVISATVYFSGANFNNVVTTSITGSSLASLTTYMQRCGPGSVVSFDNIKVSGPDGIRIIDGRSFALY